MADNAEHIFYLKNLRNGFWRLSAEKDALHAAIEALSKPMHMTPLASVEYVLQLEAEIAALRSQGQARVTRFDSRVDRNDTVPFDPDTLPIAASGDVERAGKSIDTMVDRFLCWKLPKDFHPDAGISFAPTHFQRGENADLHWPVGTNLLNALQARAMFEHCLIGVADRVAEEKTAHAQTISERDHAYDIIDKLCDAVLGADRREWSSMYFFEDAVADVEDRVASSRQCPRSEVWLRAWTSVASAANSTRPDLASAWADQCLESFDKRFSGASAR